MKVILQNDFFTPLGYRIRKGVTKTDAVNVPDVFYKNLPKSAVVVGGGPVEDIPDMSGRNPVMDELYGGDFKRQAAAAEEQKLREVAEAEEEEHKLRHLAGAADSILADGKVENDVTKVEDDVVEGPKVEEPKVEEPKVEDPEGKKTTKGVKAARRRTRTEI